MSFLKLGVGGRAVGMGEAYVALASDAAAMHYNPAGLAIDGKSEIVVMHNEWIKDVRTEFLGVKVPISGYTFGLFLNTTSIGGIEVREIPGPPEATFSAHDFAVGLSAACQIDQSLSLGITGKLLYEKLLVDESLGAAADMAVLYFPPVEGLRVGMTVSNIGSMGALHEESTKLPAAFRFGSAYSSNIESMNGKLTFAVDGFKPFSGDLFHLNLGGEFEYSESFAVRIGYQSGYESKGLSAGFGVRYGIFKIDYGFVPFSLDLGSAHIVSCGVEFQ
jgi:hypothetical protein